MDLLDFGLIFFFVPHAIPFFPKLRNRLHARLGEKGWKGAFSLISLIGLVLIGFGYAKAPYQALWTFPAFWDQVAMIAMFFAFTLIIAGTLKGHLRAILRHPMSIGFLIWGVSHVLATGDVANVKMFGSFALYSFIAIVSAEVRGKVLVFKSNTRDDIKAILTGLIFYAIFYFAHGWLFGAPVSF